MRLALAALAALALTACDSSRDGTTPVALYTDDGEVRATGILTFDGPVVPGAHVTGTFELDAAGPLPVVRPRGALEATCTAAAGEAELAVSLEPNVNDGGLYLVGSCADGLEGGEWGVGSIAGPVRRGTFRFASPGLPYGDDAL